MVYTVVVGLIMTRVELFGRSLCAGTALKKKVGGVRHWGVTRPPQPEVCGGVGEKAGGKQEVSCRVGHPFWLPWKRVTAGSSAFGLGVGGPLRWTGTLLWGVLMELCKTGGEIERSGNLIIAGTIKAC